MMSVTGGDGFADALITLSADATNVYLTMAQQITVTNKSTFNQAAVDESKWAWLIFAEYWS